MTLDLVVADLQRQIAQARGVDLRLGTVTSLSPLTVTVGGSQPYTQVRALDAAVLTVGATVAVLQSQSGLLVIGEVSASVSGWIEVGSAGAAAYQSGWQVDTMYTGYTPLRYRRRGRIVELDGFTSRPGTLSSGWTTILTLPSDMRPNTLRTMTAVAIGDVAWRVLIMTTGDVRVWSPQTHTNAWVSLSGVSIELP